MIFNQILQGLYNFLQGLSLGKPVPHSLKKCDPLKNMVLWVGLLPILNVSNVNTFNLDQPAT